MSQPPPPPPPLSAMSIDSEPRLFFLLLLRLFDFAPLLDVDLELELVRRTTRVLTTEFCGVRVAPVVVREDGSEEEEEDAAPHTESDELMREFIKMSERSLIVGGGPGPPIELDNDDDRKGRYGSSPKSRSEGVEGLSFEARDGVAAAACTRRHTPSASRSMRPLLRLCRVLLGGVVIVVVAGGAASPFSCFLSWSLRYNAINSASFSSK